MTQVSRISPNGRRRDRLSKNGLKYTFPMAISREVLHIEGSRRIWDRAASPTMRPLHGMSLSRNVEGSGRKRPTRPSRETRNSMLTSA